MTALLSGLLLLSLIVLARLLYRAGQSRQKQIDAENMTIQNRKAHAIQNNIILDPDERERVRRQFDGS